MSTRPGAPVATAPASPPPPPPLPQFTTGTQTPTPLQAALSGAPVPAFIAETAAPPSAGQMALNANQKVDCQGYWGSCDYTSFTQTYIVTAPASNGGKECPNKTGDTKPCSTEYFDSVKKFFSNNMTTENFMYLVFALIVLAVVRGVFGTLREFFGGGGGGGGRVTVVT